MALLWASRDGETLNDHALEFRKLSREEALDRFKKDAQKLDKMLADLTPEQWTSFMVYHPFAGPVPAGFYGTFQIMDYGVHPYDIEYGLGDKLATIDEATAGLILPYAFVFWQYTVDEKTAKGSTSHMGFRSTGPGREVARHGEGRQVSPNRRRFQGSRRAVPLQQRGRRCAFVLPAFPGGRRVVTRT